MSVRSVPTSWRTVGIRREPGGYPIGENDAVAATIFEFSPPSKAISRIPRSAPGRFLPRRVRGGIPSQGLLYTLRRVCSSWSTDKDRSVQWFHAVRDQPGRAGHDLGVQIRAPVCTSPGSRLYCHPSDTAGRWPATGRCPPLCGPVGNYP